MDTSRKHGDDVVKEKTRLKNLWLFAHLVALYPLGSFFHTINGFRALLMTFHPLSAFYPLSVVYRHFMAFHPLLVIFRLFGDFSSILASFRPLNDFLSITMIFFSLGGSTYLDDILLSQ